jgi:hypothetical protein
MSVGTVGQNVFNPAPFSTSVASRSLRLTFRTNHCVSYSFRAAVFFISN